MAKPRANWKGVLKVGELAAGVALYTAASTSERVAFHTLNRKTGNRVHRQFVDSETGKPVERDDQVKGYETPQGETVMLEPEEIAEAMPESDKTLTVEGFVALDAIDSVYFDRPYYLAPSEDASAEAFDLLREGMRGAKVAALAQAVLFRRLRSVLIRPDDEGMIATTLNFDYEVRSEEEAFADIPKHKLDKELLDLAGHIIKTKSGRFDPAAFDDRYEAALADLVKAKLEGRKLKPQPKKREGKVVSLLEALRESAKGGGAAKPARKRA